MNESTIDTELDDLIYKLETWGYPPALQKACYDNFLYALRTKSGQNIYFAEAVPVSKEWVILREVENPDFPGSDEQASDVLTKDGSYEAAKPNFERGIDLRVSEIEWVCDAPYGS